MHCPNPRAGKAKPMEALYSPLAVTLKLAAVSTVLLLLLGTPLAWWLRRGRTPLRVVVEALVALPLVLPPTVLGFYLLLAFAPHSPLGASWLALTGRPLAFSFSGLVIGSLLYSLPFVVQPLQAGFEQLDDGLLETAATLGASPTGQFFALVLPLTRRSFATAAGLGFAHTIGEFGVVLMIGGSIPGETRVLSIALYENVEALEYGQAHLLAGVLLLCSFLALAFIYGVLRQRAGIRA